MNKETDIVAKKIESGEYFADAMNWFHAKFTRPRTEFAYFFIICVIAVLAFLVGLVAFSQVFPLSPGKNFIMGRPIDAGERLTIRGIQKSGETANDSIMKFMLGEYVKSREEYKEERLDRNFRIVKTFSTDEVFDQYLQDTSPSNPQNPVILYGKQAIRDIIVTDIKLLDATGKEAHDENVTRVIVNYTTILTYLSDNSTQISYNEADITFNYKQITVDQETGKISHKPEMKVVNYKVNTLQNPKK